MTMKLNNGLENSIRRPRRCHGECPSSVLLTRTQVAAVARELLTVKKCDKQVPWSHKGFAQAHREDHVIGPVVEQLPREWEKLTT